MKTNKKPFPVLDYIIQWEEGDISEENFLALFQHLVDTAYAWKLQGSYGRQAAALIEAGIITAPSE
jgi:hypothetical protein